MVGVVGPYLESYKRLRTVKKMIYSRICLESIIKEGDSPVSEINHSVWVWNLSTTGHVKPCWKLGRPRSKAKYVIATDSA